MKRVGMQVAVSAAMVAVDQAVRTFVQEKLSPVFKKKSDSSDDCCK